MEDIPAKSLSTCRRPVVDMKNQEVINHQKEIEKEKQIEIEKEGGEEENDKGKMTNTLSPASSSISISTPKSNILLKQ